MNKFGTVLVFKEGVSRSQIADALKQIEDVIDPSYHLSVAEQKRWNHTDRELARIVSNDKGQTLAVVNEFESDYGGPVWYIP